MKLFVAFVVLGLLVPSVARAKSTRPAKTKAVSHLTDVREALHEHVLWLEDNHWYDAIQHVEIDGRGRLVVVAVSKPQQPLWRYRH